MSPSKGIYLTGDAANAIETRGENDDLHNKSLASRGNDSILEDSVGKDGQKAKQYKWDRNGKMPPQMMKRWFGGGPLTDQEITILFK